MLISMLDGRSSGTGQDNKFCLQDKVHPQTIAVLQSRADGLGLTVQVGDETKFNVDKDVSGVLVQYPATDGTVHNYKVCLAS